MITDKPMTIESAGSDLIIERTFDAPRDLVWKAWTDCQHVMDWWGPKDFSACACDSDLHVGGTYLYCMRAPDGKEFYSTGTYREIVPMERIVATDSFADEKGNVVPASYYGFEDEFPSELLLTVTFAGSNGQTMLTLRHAGMPAGEQSEMARAGWNESLDKLADALSRQSMM
jgi:uncharacterized protein YndB with AHSA1/START domain